MARPKAGREKLRRSELPPAQPRRTDAPPSSLVPNSLHVSGDPDSPRRSPEAKRGESSRRVPPGERGACEGSLPGMLPEQESLCVQTYRRGSGGACPPDMAPDQMRGDALRRAPRGQARVLRRGDARVRGRGVRRQIRPGVPAIPGPASALDRPHEGGPLAAMRMRLRRDSFAGES